ncbi:hypothetical protein SNE40_005163 [Patella caerulea]|uniref:Lipase domain-containing protein n=1 Tax=Patella caerulea TaxID=87958 RepID=A0AAN8KAW8_PATCE
MSKICLYINLWFIIHVSRASGWFFLSNNKPVCYPPFGCYNTSYPFNNSANILPQSPERVGVGIYVFQDQLHSVRLDWDVSIQELSALIVPGLKTVILIHGYQDNGRTPWIMKMVPELFNNWEPMNILSLDWRRGADELVYLQAVANTRIVGALGAEVVRKLVAVGVSSRVMHLIGHSLGAHVAGYIGTEVKDSNRIFRISGLDPAGPYFEGTPPMVRLDSTDAVFVDVAHTNTEPLHTLGLGILEPSGTVDFYPNGGVNQPGCGSTLLGRILNLFEKRDLQQSIGCSHLRATDLYTESINSECQYATHYCLHNISESSCLPCTNVDCPQFGYNSVQHGFAGIFYFRTNSQSPFCTYPYSNPYF